MDMIATDERLIAETLENSGIDAHAPGWTFGTVLPRLLPSIANAATTVYVVKYLPKYVSEKARKGSGYQDSSRLHALSGCGSYLLELTCSAVGEKS